MKKTILHIIYNLVRGGAETMLVTVVKELSDYTNIVVTLYPENHFKEELKCDKYYCLNLTSIFQLPFKAGMLKKIIKENNVDIVHSHLFWPTVLARMATPKKVVLITTIHAFIATSVEYKRWYVRLLDKITYRLHKNIIIAVAKGALQEYFDFLKLKRYKAYALPTFADIRIFNDSNAGIKKENAIFKMLTVGNLRKQKNHKYLLEAFRLLDNKSFQLDIYGHGVLHDEIESFIKKHNLNIHLMGTVKNIQTVLTQYDLYIMSSTYEGFSLSVLEAMAMKVPLLLSDIPSFREQCEETAVYFSLDTINDFAVKLKTLASDRDKLLKMGTESRERIINNFTLEHHMNGLREIYEEALLKPH